MALRTTNVRTFIVDGGFRPHLDLSAQSTVMPDLAWNGVTVGNKIAR